MPLPTGQTCSYITAPPTNRTMHLHTGPPDSAPSSQDPQVTPTPVPSPVPAPYPHSDTHLAPWEEEHIQLRLGILSNLVCLGPLPTRLFPPLELVIHFRHHLLVTAPLPQLPRRPQEESRKATPAGGRRAGWALTFTFTWRRPSLPIPSLPRQALTKGTCVRKEMRELPDLGRRAKAWDG